MTSAACRVRRWKVFRLLWIRPARNSFAMAYNNANLAGLMPLQAAWRGATEGHRSPRQTPPSGTLALDILALGAIQRHEPEADRLLYSFAGEDACLLPNTVGVPLAWLGSSG